MTPALDHTRRLLDTPPTPPIPGQLDFTRSDMATTGCTTWLVTPQTIAAVDDAVDGYGTYAKGYFEFVDGRTAVVGLRVGTGPDRVVARFGDTLVRHPDGRWSVRPATP